MNHYVYEITNLINGKKYIGKRSCKCPIEEDKYMGSGIYLKKDIKKYGISNFSKKILAICDNEQMVTELEYYYICKRNAIVSDSYYNEYLCPVEINLKSNEEENTEEFRKKISKKMKGVNVAEKGPNAKKVVCITTGEIFDAIILAENKYGVNHSHISACCRRKQKTAGKLPSGTKLQWMYYEDYLKLDDKEGII